MGKDEAGAAGNELQTEGRKDDSGKLRFDLIPGYPLEQLAEVYTRGAQKYADWNWAKGINWSRIYAAMERHLEAWRRGEEIDPDNGQLHLASVAWGAFTLMEYARIRRAYDDRFVEEEWLPLPTAPAYEVSTEGRIRKGDLLLRPADNGKGYRYFSVYEAGERTRWYVHQAVITAFVRPLEADELVNHRNGVRADNRLSNLEILDAAGNILEAYRQGRPRLKPGESVKPAGIAAANATILYAAPGAVETVTTPALGGCVVLRPEGIGETNG